MVGSRVLAKWRAPEGGAHGRKKWFEGTVQLVKPNGKFYVVYDDGDSEDDVLQWNLQLLVDLTRDTSYEVPREKHVQMRKPSNHDRTAVRNSADASSATVTVPCGSAAVMQETTGTEGVEAAVGNGSKIRKVVSGRKWVDGKWVKIGNTTGRDVLEETLHASCTKTKERECKGV
jgi:hypothetical protein